jgi:hypothetical protein
MATGSPMPQYPPAQAIDGKFTTRWASQQMVDPQFLQLDYGAPVHISDVQILWESACAKDYTIDVSNDATNWTTIKTVVGNTIGSNPMPTGWMGTGFVDLTGLSGVGRYMRMNGTVRCTALYGYSIWEIRAFGDTNASCTP